MFVAYRIDFLKKSIAILGTYEKKSDADEAVYLDRCDEQAPDKHDAHTWGVKELPEWVAEIVRRP